MKKSLLLLHRIFRKTHAYQVIGVFIIFVFVAALIFLEAEPGITRYGDALWYSYVNLFTIGFGDIVPVTAAGRIVSVILTVYASVVIAILTAVIVTFYKLRLKLERDSSFDEVSSALERLDELSKDELHDLSEKIKKIKKERDNL